MVFVKYSRADVSLRAFVELRLVCREDVALVLARVLVQVVACVREQLFGSS